MRDLYQPTFLQRGQHVFEERGRKRQNTENWARATTRAGDVVLIGTNVKKRIGQSGIADLTREAIAKISKPFAIGHRDRQVVTVDLGRVIGHDDCVAAPEITIDQVASFAMIPRHHEPVRVVTNTQPAPCRTLTLVIEARAVDFALIAAWIGRETPRQPHDTAFDRPFEQAATELAFWCRNALVAKPEYGAIWKSTWRDVILEAVS